MPHYRYLIVGGGMTADAAVGGIREVDSEGTIGLISEETHPPYDRPPLSKGLWKGKPVEKIWRRPEQKGAELHLGRRVESIDPQGKQVVDHAGQVYTYEKLLIATGGSPRRLSFGGENIVYFRTLDDYQYLRSRAEERRRFAVIGGGFIGSEIAAALAQAGQQVVMTFPEVGIGGLGFPKDLAKFLSDYYRQRGVEVLAGDLSDSLEMASGGLIVHTRAGRALAVDEVVAGIGIQPNTRLAASAGIVVDDGIRVDENLRTNQPDIYAAGDVAWFYNPALQRYLRVEHEDNANTQGRIAGLNMAGQALPYHHLPYFYSDLFDLGYEAVGELDARLETFADWQEPFRKGIVYYLKEGRVRGVLLWNVWDQVEAARRLIADPGPITPRDLKGRLPQ